MFLGSVFSDEECEGMNITPSAVSPSRSYSVPASNNMDYPEEPPMELKKPREQTQFSPPANFSPSVDDNEDVEQELDMFNKAIHISNIDEVSFEIIEGDWERSNITWLFFTSFVFFLLLSNVFNQIPFHYLALAINTLKTTFCQWIT